MRYGLRLTLGATRRKQCCDASAYMYKGYLARRFSTTHLPNDAAQQSRNECSNSQAFTMHCLTGSVLHSSIKSHFFMIVTSAIKLFA